MYIEHVRATIKDMLDAIDDRDQAAIEAAYPPFRDAVVAAWQAYQNGTITLQLHGQAIPRLMTAYIADELARELADPDQWKKAGHEIRKMQNLLATVGAPTEISES